MQPTDPGGGPKHAQPPEMSWRRAIRLAAAWVSPPAILFGVAIVVILNQRGSLTIVVSILMLGIYPALPIAAGQSHGSWRMAWMTLLIEFLALLVGGCVIFIIQFIRFGYLAP
jgi:hypothetical protein